MFDNTQDLARFTGSVTANHRPSSWFSHRLTLGFDQTGEDNQALTQFMPPDVAQFYDPVIGPGADHDQSPGHLVLHRGLLRDRPLQPVLQDQLRDLGRRASITSGGSTRSR